VSDAMDVITVMNRNNGGSEKVDGKTQGRKHLAETPKKPKTPLKP